MDGNRISSEPSFHTFQQQLSDEAIPHILDATVPFYYIRGDFVKRDRSGVFLRVGDDYFILTAAHGLMEMVGNRTYIYMDWDEEESIPIPVPPGAFFMGTESDCRDVAIIHLGLKVAEKLLNRKKPLSLRDLICDAPSKPGLFLICGFPQDWTRKIDETLHCQPLSFLARTFDRDVIYSSEIKFIPEVHGAFDFSSNAIRLDSREREILPEHKGIRGISGCGIWQVSEWDTLSFNSWSLKQLKLIAIQHRYCEQHCYVIGTWVKHAIDRLSEDRPGVAKAKTIVYPN